MPFLEEKFLKCADDLNDDLYNYGNDVLYRNFNYSILPAPGADEIDTKLSSAIGTLGNAYSASPVRSAPKGALVNAGLGSSFDLIAERIYHSEEYKELHDEILSLNAKSYDYDASADHDRKLLKRTVDLVGKLNAMVKKAMEENAKDGKKSDNVISFCSKFLHFMCPRLFFIYDSYSVEGGVSLYREREGRKLVVSENDAHNLEIDQSVRGYFNENYQLLSWENNYDQPLRTYYDHCVRAYAVARFLNDKGKVCTPQISGVSNSCYMPRLVDAVLMRIKPVVAK